MFLFPWRILVFIFGAPSLHVLYTFYASFLRCVFLHISLLSQAGLYTFLAYVHLVICVHVCLHKIQKRGKEMGKTDGHIFLRMKGNRKDVLFC